LATVNEKLLAGILIATVIILGSVVALLVNSRPVSSTGKIKALNCEIWADANRTIKLQQIDWGVLGPGDVAAVTFWIQNIGNINGTLSFNTTDWQFSGVLSNSTVPANASSYLVYSWNYTNYVLKPFETVPIQMQFAVSPQIVNISQFNCTINVWIQEYK
jgi:hypothetical protein